MPIPVTDVQPTSPSQPAAPGRGPELVIGLVGALGTDLKAISDSLAHELRAVNYDPKVIKITDLLLDLPAYAGQKNVKNGPEDVRIKALMGLGDHFRIKCGRGDAAATLAILQIQYIRGQKNGGDSDSLLPRTAFIIHSLKHPEEIETLRSVYQSSFICISAYMPREKRTFSLASRIAKSRGRYNENEFIDVAKELIKEDDKGKSGKLGQDVRDTYPLADFFVDTTKIAETEKQIERFVKILFGFPYATPTRDEYGMFHAKAAALRSADLARQVGAVITTNDGELIAAGCNEVPLAEGGAYWEGSESTIEDNRDFQVGFDSTARFKREVVQEILERLGKEWLSERLSGRQPSDLVEDLLFKGGPPILKGTRADGILEFGRVVHAEMSAITVAAKRGLPVGGQNLYCTTFPCHMCARHIIASGIKKVVYIEPYPKSLTKDLYGKSVRIDHEKLADSNAVEFSPFFGVAPRRYIDFFEMGETIKRKDGRGMTVVWEKLNARPRVNQIQSYSGAELAIVLEMKPFIETTSEGK